MWLILILDLLAWFWMPPIWFLRRPSFQTHRNTIRFSRISSSIFSLFLLTHFSSSWSRIFFLASSNNGSIFGIHIFLCVLFSVHVSSVFSCVLPLVFLCVSCVFSPYDIPLCLSFVFLCVFLLSLAAQQPSVSNWALRHTIGRSFELDIRAFVHLLAAGCGYESDKMFLFMQDKTIDLAYVCVLAHTSVC